VRSLVAGWTDGAGVSRRHHKTLLR